MQLKITTLITLLSAASLHVSLAAPTNNTYKPKYTPSGNIQHPNSQASAVPPAVSPPAIVPTPNEVSTPAGAIVNIQARLQLELERQTTFIQREIPVPGRIPLALETLFSAFIVSVEDISTGNELNVPVTCQGLDAQGRAAGAPIHIGAESGDAGLNGGLAVQVAFIECVEVE